MNRQEELTGAGRGGGRWRNSCCLCYVKVRRLQKIRSLENPFTHQGKVSRRITGRGMEGEDANALQIFNPLPGSALNPAPSLSSCICARGRPEKEILKDKSTNLLFNLLVKSQFQNSLVVQWLKLHLPILGTQVRSLVQEDPTCRGATRPMHHNYWSPST